MSDLARLADAAESIAQHLSTLLELQLREQRRAWTADEAASVLGYATGSPVRRLIREGRLATVEGLLDYRIPRAEIDRFVEQTSTEHAPRKAKRRRSESEVPNIRIVN